MTRRSVEIGCAVAVALLLLAVWAKPEIPVDETIWSTRYDYLYKKHAKHYFGVLFDWRWFKAQGIAESSLRRFAFSNKGAVGIMQILPKTFNEIFEDPVLLPGITEPRWNIAAGIAYDRYLYDRWSHHVPRSQRFAFALASYNAGFSTVKHAYNRAKADGRNATEWEQISSYVPDETDNYVKKISDLMGRPG